PNDASAGTQNELYDGSTNRTYLYFDLDEPITDGPHATQRLREEYLRGIGDELYFKALIKLTNQSWAPRYGTTDAHKEYVSGYAELAKNTDGKIEVGLVDNGGNPHTQAWIRVEAVSIRDNDNATVKTHPFSLAAWNATALYQNHLIYKGTTSFEDASGSLGIAALQSVVGFFRDVYLLFSSRNRELRRLEFGQEIDLGQSFIRLSASGGTKYGGGCRVKEIRMFDNWDQMAPGNPAESEYGQTYSYTTTAAFTDPVSGETSLEEVSSGVASYEPLIGGEENPFRQPVHYAENNFLVPDEDYFQETPYGESLFPSAGIGYSKVIVRNIDHANVRRHATGYTVNEFYTAKDFSTL
ncbi:MAG: hypothetical protein AAF570_28905, partial [Bacteroidota bacterium]